MLEEGLSVGGKYLREIYEVINHNSAYQYVKKCISEGLSLNENIIKDIHLILMGGLYHNVIAMLEEEQLDKYLSMNRNIL